MFYVIGGNGSHAGATAIYEQVTAGFDIILSE